ncbi:unnamed protein product, partial [Oppiella nova]
MRSQINKILTIGAYSTQNCFDEFVVYLNDKASLDDIFTPIEMSLSYSLIQLRTKNNTFCAKCPIIKDNKVVTNEIHFQTGCRVDEKCVSKLKISTKTLLNNKPYKRSDVIWEGHHRTLTLVTT